MLGESFKSWGPSMYIYEQLSDEYIPGQLINLHIYINIMQTTL